MFYPTKIIKNIVIGTCSIIAVSFICSGLKSIGKWFLCKCSYLDTDKKNYEKLKNKEKRKIKRKLI